MSPSVSSVSECLLGAESHPSPKQGDLRQDENGKVLLLHPWSPSTRALGGAGHRHTGLDLEAIRHCRLLPAAPG